MTTYHFQQVHHSAYRVGKCPVCAKTVKRSKKFTQTVNPWNKNPDGTVKTFLEVLASVQVEAAQWVPDFTHGRCAS